MNTPNPYHEEICAELLAIADECQQIIGNCLPDAPVNAVSLFIEITRFKDSYEVIESFNPQYHESPPHEVDIIRMGWNPAIFYLFKKLTIKGYPMTQSTEATLKDAGNILYNLGCITMLRRTVEMIKYGYVSVEKSNNIFTFRKLGILDMQFLDDMELTNWRKQSEEIKNHPLDHWNYWQLYTGEDFECIKHKPGFHFLRRPEVAEKFGTYILPEIDQLMIPLIKIWDSGYGPMVGYRSSPEIDNHFLSLAMTLVDIWKNEAGFHPEIKFGKVSGIDISMIVLLLVALHLKHIRFTALALKQYPRINFQQSLVILESRDDLVKNISGFTGLDEALVLSILNIIMMKPQDTQYVHSYGSRFMPLLFDLENGYIIRPVSGIIRNPFFSIITLLEHRDANARHIISAHREEWLRMDLYALFEGTRYKRVEGNIRLRKDNKVVTDIDACIFDTLTGELALFQIKWQDFFYNDVKKLKSKATNLARELTEWSDKVHEWMHEFGTIQLLNALRLKNIKESDIKEILLFGISRSVARTEGYGIKNSNERLAVSTWPEFIRLRTNLKPMAPAFSTLFQKLKMEKKAPGTTPVLTELKLGNYVMKFEDLWVAFHEE